MLEMQRDLKELELQVVKVEPPFKEIEEELLETLYVFKKELVAQGYDNKDRDRIKKAILVTETALKALNLSRFNSTPKVAPVFLEDL